MTEYRPTEINQIDLRSGDCLVLRWTDGKQARRSVVRLLADVDTGEQIEKEHGPWRAVSVEALSHCDGLDLGAVRLIERGPSGIAGDRVLRVEVVISARNIEMVRYR